MVVALQTFGSQLQCNPHLHCLVSDGLFRKGGEFVPFPLFDEGFEKLLTETFRRLVLDALVKARRLSEDFRDRLLSFGHGGGFSVYAEYRVMWSSRVASPLWRAFDAVTTPHYPGSRSEAIRASGARNLPRRRAGGSTASTASSFSVGSMRRYTSVVFTSA
jgi:hypothetical protein